jgi:hypothetical protein
MVLPWLIHLLSPSSGYERVNTHDAWKVVTWIRGGVRQKMEFRVGR